jgi:hypothetical protein
MTTRYAHLLSEGRIGALTLRNRILVTAMGVSLSEPDGTVGERLIAYHEEQAKGGAGLIITGVAGVAWPTGAVQPNQTAISDDRFLPGLAALVERVHATGRRSPRSCTTAGWWQAILPMLSTRSCGRRAIRRRSRAISSTISCLRK